jgi:peptidoglycan/LPS O-acetylase OafA/YrhL
VTWFRSIAIWLVIIIAESIHGALRQLYLAPLIGDFPARRVSVFTAIGLILVISLLTIRWLQAHDGGTLVRIGALWVTLTILFEAGLGRALGYDWKRILEDYDLSKGGLMALGLLAMLFTPLIAARVRGVR